MALLSENLAEVARNKIKLNILLFTVLAQKKSKLLSLYYRSLVNK